jgi:hypothetical protein
MQTNKTMGRLVLTAAVVSALVAVTAKAQYSNPFDNSGSISAFGFDYGSGANITHGVSWASGPTYDAGGSSLSGSMNFTLGFNNALDSADEIAFTGGVIYPAADQVDLSFDLMVGTGSATDSYGGYGYFKIATRLTDSYTFTQVYANELGPNWGLNVPAGTWVHINIPLTIGAGGTGTALRALTFDDYSDAATRNINGNVQLYIDNLTLTPVPEPSTIALVGLGLAGLLFVRRNRTARS